MTAVWYNEIEPSAVAWLRSLMRHDLIPFGYIDTRPIQEIKPADLEGFTQCHFFAGIGTWAYSARKAGWPNDRPIWTASCPCQPFSNTGKREGFDDPRDLWPHLFSLVRVCRPADVMGEQVSGSLGYDWLDRVYDDLEAEGYAPWSRDIPACAVNSPQQRNRIYWVAGRDGAMAGGHVGGVRNTRCSSAFSETGETETEARQQRLRFDVASEHVARVVVDGESERRGEGRPSSDIQRRRGAPAGPDAPSVMGDPDSEGLPLGEGEPRDPCEELTAPVGANDSTVWRFYEEHDWTLCHDEKWRRTQPGTPLLVDGFAGRIPMWHGLGNAIHAGLAEEVIRAWLETEGDRLRSAPCGPGDLASVVARNGAARRVLTDILAHHA